MGGDGFRFITFQNAEDFKSRDKRRAVRSHIIKRTFERKKGSFKNANAQQLATERQPAPLNVSSATSMITAINVESLDPFESLPVDQYELQLLLRHPIAQQAVEPVFSISDPYSFHDLHDAYRNAFADPAFTNSLMCAISLAKHNYTFTPDVLRYQSFAINHINHQLRSPSSYECTIGAILLLVGVEWRMHSSDKAQIHLRGIEQLLHVCESEKRTLSASVRRGIFWQDVDTAIVSARHRVLSRSTFPEFQWGRATFKVDWARLPLGFQDLRGELGEATDDPLRDICISLQDIYVLQKHGEALMCHKPGIDLIHAMDNMQACIESRLIEQLQENQENCLRMAVLLAAYLYTYSLFTQIWNGSSIPLYIALRLLKHLQTITCAFLSERRRAIVLWCTFVGGSLIPEGPTRTSFGLLLQSSFSELILSTSINSSWFAISGMLDQFLWSQANFDSRALGFLRENLMIVTSSSEPPT